MTRIISVKNAAWTLSRDIKHVCKSYDEIYKTCDYITVHVPYMPEHKGAFEQGCLRSDEGRCCCIKLCP